MDKKIFKSFKALGEPTRLKILKMLSIQSMCVCELSEVLDMLQPRISQHLKILKDVDLVIESREGYWTYYSINSHVMDNLWRNFKEFLAADLKELQGFEMEYKRYTNLETNEKVNKTKENIKRGNVKAR